MKGVRLVFYNHFLPMDGQFRHHLLKIILSPLHCLCSCVKEQLNYIDVALFLDSILFH